MVGDSLVWRRALKATLPVAMGYYPAGIAFGVLFSAAGLPMWLCVLLSISMFSGAAQYAAIPLFAAGAGVATLTLNTLIINLRHLFYGIPLLKAVPEKRWQRIYAFFGLTDETFSVMTTLPEDERKPLFFHVSLLNHFYWVSASLIGYLLGGGLNRMIPHLDFALICLFVVLWYEQFLSRHMLWPAVAAVIAFFFAKSVTADYVLLLAVGLCAVMIIAESASPYRVEKKWSWAVVGVVLSCVAMLVLAFAPNLQNNESSAHQLVRQETWQQIAAVACMGAVTFLLRYAPNFIPKFLFRSPYLQAMNLALPLAVMTVLILDGIDTNGAFFSGSFKILTAQVTSLLSVWIVYRRWRNVLLSMVAGVAVLNIVLGILQAA